MKININKGEFIFWNIFILLIFLLLGLISPSYLSPIRYHTFQLKNIEIIKLNLRVPKLIFFEKNKKYSFLCRDVKGINGKNLCNEKFPLKVDKMEVTVILDGLYSSSENISVIDKVYWKTSEQMHNIFILEKDSRISQIQYWKNQKYFFFFLYIFSVLVLSYFTQYRSKL
ncbi:hypothetical protein ACKLNO_11570 [Neisseriaceae bacterium B1]